VKQDFIKMDNRISDFEQHITGITPKNVALKITETINKDIKSGNFERINHILISPKYFYLSLF